MPARQIHTPIAAKGAFDTYTAGSVTGVFLPAIVADKEQVAFTGRELIIARNADAGGAHLVTISSVVNERNRTGDIAIYSIAASSVAVFYINQLRGWRQTGGLLYFEADNINIQFCVVRMP